MTDGNVDEQAYRTATRRAIIKATGGAAALATGVGSASAHKFSSDTSSTSSDDHDHTDGSVHDSSSNAELLDYHSLGDVGPSSESGSPDSPHYGGITEIRTHGDYAYVGIFSSDDPTNDRGMAIVDVSEFNEASNTKERREAELNVVSFLRNDNPGSAVMDVKVSDDGDYVFISKQPYTALFNETDPTPGTDGDSTSTSASAVQAVDVTDPENPMVVGTYDAWDTGPHNSYYHRIDGTDYVFSVKDLNDGTAGLYVFQFERTTGALVLVNQWTLDGDLLDEQVGDSGTLYIHDITVQNDPKTGKPYGYLSYWGAGLRVLDLTDPTDIVEIGRFAGDAIHYSEPAPALVDGKRVVVAGQERSSASNETESDDPGSGKVYLLDADGIDDGYDGSPNVTALDSWEWRPNATFANFTLSPHNFDVTENGWVHLAHYHGGVRYLKIDKADWTLAEKGYFRGSKDVPESSKMEGLNHAVPFTWGAVEHNGVTFASDINTGVYALTYKPSTNNKTAAYGVGAVATAAAAGLIGRYSDRVQKLLDDSS